MKTIKKGAVMLIIAILSIIVLSSEVKAATVGIKASSSKVTVGNNVTVTVSFGEQVKAAQFKLSYDTSKFDYVGCTAGTLGAGGTYAFLDFTGGQSTIASVTFTFKSKATGSGSFSISGITLPVSYNTSSSSTSVTVEKATSSGNNNSNTNTSKPKPSTKPSTTTKPNTAGQEPEKQIDKAELYSFIQSMTDLVQSDYTEESWKALQDAIAEAENATTEEAFAGAKEKLKLETLVPQNFEKPELDKVLRQLIGKLEKDYTNDSWQELINAIDKAESTQLKSEYDEIKDKLTINNLILEEDKGFFGELLDRMQEDPLILGLVVFIGVLTLILIIVIGVSIRRSRQDDFERAMPRRMK